MIQKKWSQVFLKDSHIINTIINIFNPTKNQTIVEIGPGLGALTQPISNITNSLILIECDPHLTQILTHMFRQKQLKILNQDVMTINFFNLISQNQQKIRLIGNLPYNIATKLIIYLFKYLDIIDDMHFMIQKEVGQRIIAEPNNKKYGRLSIITQYHFKVSPVLEISKTSFNPIPNVESMMIKFVPHHTQKPYPNVNIQTLSFLTKLAFHQRRKTIRNSLSLYLNKSEITETNIDINLRAENLNIHNFCILAIKLHNKIYHK